MEILSFDIVGKFAHFKKYYANNTALSFSIPPRTTIIGIIAGAIGMSKDSYYEQLNSQNILIGIALKTKIKKNFHRLNYLMIKSLDDLRGRKGHIQTPFEVITPVDIKSENIRYRIFVSYKEGGKKIFEKIKTTFLEKKFVYNTTLGTANFIGKIENTKLYDENSIRKMQLKGQIISLNSACLSDNVEKIIYDKSEISRYSMIEEELLPADFKANNDRELIKMNRVIFAYGDYELNVEFTGTVYEITDKQEKQIIQFLD